MSTGVVPRRVVSQEQQDRQREAELKIVEHARAESRKEAAALEQMKLRVGVTKGAPKRAHHFRSRFACKQ